MVQTRSDAPVNTGTAPAAAADTTPAVRAADTSRVGDDSTTLKDAISGAALGAGDNKANLDEVRSLNGKPEGSDDSLGLPAVELHDPRDEGGDETGAGADGGSRGGADSEPSRGDTVSGTADGATDGAPNANSDATQPDTETDAPGQPGDQTRGQNPRDASPFKRNGTPNTLDVTGTTVLNAPELAGMWDNMAETKLQAGTNHNAAATEPSMIRQFAQVVGGSSGVSSVGSAGAASVVRAGADAAAHNQNQSQNHRSDHHQRQGLIQRIRDRRHR